MNQAQIICLYESVADITAHMLAAARNSDWEALGALESDCASQIRSLESAESAGLEPLLTEAMRLHKRTLIQTILMSNRELSHLTASRMSQLSNLLNQANVERQLSMAYGSHQVA